MSEKVKSFKTINEVEEYRKLINEACDARRDFINLCAIAETASNKNFGFIKECFETISPELIKSSDGKRVMNKYSKLIRENKNLSSLHMLYENIRKANKDGDIDFLINNIANVEWGVNSKTISEDTNKLGRILAEGMLLIGNKSIEMLPNENVSLNKATKFISENKKTSKNISSYSYALKVIRENINNSEEKGNIFEEVDLDELSNKLLKEFNKKYTNELSREETIALKEISSSENREDVFNKYKENCKKKISEAIENFTKNGDLSSSQRLSTVIEQIENKKFSLETVGSDICSLIELSNIF